MTNHCKTLRLKITAIILLFLMVSVGQEFGRTAWLGSSGSGSLMYSQMVEQQKAGVAGGCQGISPPCDLSVWVCFALLHTVWAAQDTHYAHMTVNTFKRQVQLPGRNDFSSFELAAEVRCHQFCHILLVTKSQACPDFKRGTLDTIS